MRPCYNTNMENDQIRKRVYMQTHTSTLINPRPALSPQWISQSQLSYASAYQFGSYNVEAESMEMIARRQGEQEALLVHFKRESAELHHELYYIYKDKQSFFLVHQPEETATPILLFRKDNQQKSKAVEKFLDFIISNTLDDPLFGSQNLLNRTQQLIEQFKEEEEVREEEKEGDYDLQAIIGLQVVFQCNFALLQVQTKRFNGIMLVNLARAQLEGQKDFKCGFSAVSLDRYQAVLTEEDAACSKIVYLFPQKVLQVVRTTDITQFLILTENHLLLIKINYELMELCILNKVKTTRQRSRVVSVALSSVGDEDYAVCVVEIGKAMSIKTLKDKTKRSLKLFRLHDKKIVEIRNQPNYANAPKYECQGGRTLKFLDQSETLHQIKFSNKIVESHYQLSDSEQQGVGFDNNVIINVFNSMLNEQGRSQQKILFQKEAQSQRNNPFDPNTIAPSPESPKSPDKPIKDIAGVVANKGLIAMWERDESVIHLCRVVTGREIQQRHQKDKEAQSNKNANKVLMKEKEMKDIYTQLMGNPLPPKQDTVLDLQSRIEYVRRVELDLACAKISALTLSPNGYNLLVVGSSGMQAKQAFTYWVFQLQLFSQLANPDPNMFLKPIRHVYKNKPTEHIATSLVREMPIFLTGNLVHTLDNQLLQGALSFDVHPYHLFLAVSFGFTTKVYALEGAERVSSLHTINLQGIKQVRYSPLGNHLCLLASKCIRVLDAYSFTLKFTIPQKFSSFARCSYSSNGLQLHTLSENHCFTVYNCFDYTRIDLFRPSPAANDAKPLSVTGFAKHLMYCMVLDGGALLVRHKPEAIVLNHDQLHRYLDGEKISAIQIDQKNGILFAGCASGKLRAHLWPLRDNNFEYYSEIRIGFSSIHSLALSNLNYFLYVGSENGNASKVKFLIDRDRGATLQPSPHNPLFAESSLKYVNMSGNSNIEKVYRFVLSSASSVNEELPQKLRLQYKLSQVINRLNEEMMKLKAEVREQIEQKIKLNTNKFDINLFHHLNKMITTKLANQYIEEQDQNHREREELKQRHAEQLKQLLAEQNDLLQQKTLLISSHVTTRNQLKEANAKQLQEFIRSQQIQVDQMQRSANYANQRSQCPDDEVYYLPTASYDYAEEKERLAAQLAAESAKFYQLRKECAHKETNIRGMNSKKVKEEALEFKFELETAEMKKKQEYSKGVLDKLKADIEQAEQKVHAMQAQTEVIKGNAQFKKIATLEEMNDACSYKLWVKEKTEKEIHELCVHLRTLQEFLESKSGEMVDIVLTKEQRHQQITTLQSIAAAKKHALQLSRIHLLDSKNKIKTINHSKEIPNTSLTSRQRFSAGPNRVGLQRAASSRQMVKSDKDVSLFNSIMDKQMNFLKTTMKIHKRKIKNFGKENGELLTQFEKLKYENKSLLDQQKGDEKVIKQLKKEMKHGESEGCSPSKGNIQVHLVKTSFQKYLQQKNKMGGASRFKTAANTPRMASPPNFD